MEKDWRPKASDNQFEKIKVEKTEFVPSKPSKHLEDAPVFENGIDEGVPLGRSKIKYIGLACLGLIILALLVFLGSRAVTGYSVYGAMQESGVPETYVTNMAGLQSELTNTKDQLTQTAGALTQAQQARDEAVTQTAELATKNEDLTQKLSESEATGAALERERDEARTALEDSAKQLCCVQKIFKPEINSYGLDNGAVVCGEGLTIRISC